MSGLILNGDTSGSVTINVPAVAGSSTVTLPSTTGNIPVLPTGYSLGAGDTTRFKNRIINGDCRIDQRNAGALVNPAVAGNFYTDRWYYNASQASKLSAGQNAGSVTPPVGFTNYLGFTSLSAYSVGAGETFYFGQKIEGLNIGDLGWGTANAKTITVSFWVRSSLTGTFSGALRNSAANRAYPFTYTINSANTWEYKTITIAGDTTGTWLATNGIGIELDFNLGTGSTLSTTSGVWAAGNYVAATGSTSVVGTSGATFYITGVQLEVGSQATSFEYVDYGTQLALCKRYFQYAINSGRFYTSDGYWGIGFPFSVETRAIPTTTYLSTSNGTLSSPTGVIHISQYESDLQFYPGVGTHWGFGIKISVNAEL